jgi:hypothetical protein
MGVFGEEGEREGRREKEEGEVCGGVLGEGSGLAQR